MHKGYKKTVSLLIVVALMSALLCFPVSAVTHYWELSMPISQPNCTDTFAYMEVTVQDPNTGALYPSVFLINAVLPIGRTDTPESPSLCVRLKSANTIEFFETASSDYVYEIMYVGGSGDVWTIGSTEYNNGSVSTTYVNNIVSIYYYGFTNRSGNPVVNAVSDISYIYGSDNASIRLLESIQNILLNQSNADITSAINSQTQQQNQNAANIQSNANQNAANIQNNANQNAANIQSNANQNAANIQNNADKNASDIQANQDKNTQSQIQADKDLYDKEKQEISDSGNQATDAADSIPNESEGFINALGTFVGTMSTTDTSCSITFPALTVPSIAGLPEATLSQEQEVNFEDAVALIPSDIMRLIQALTTIALIVFCFKELYDTISEALTRKKANADG